MGAWNLYFLLKLYLYLKAQVTPLWGVNLAFALALAVPLRRRAWRVLRHCVAACIAIPLLYHEAHMPPFSRVLAEASNLASFSPGYFLELLGRFISPLMAVGAVAVVLVYCVVNRWVRVSTLVLLALVALPVAQFALNLSSRPGAYAAPAGGALAVNPANTGAPGTVVSAPEDFNATLTAFHRAEATRQVAFPHEPVASADAFDIIVLHICSLAWDDLDVSKTRNAPLLKHFDYLFTNFSSGASYSGPAAIRVLRASCGQAEHDALYKDAPANCHIFGALAQVGYTPQVIMNHDGHFDDFTHIVESNLGVPGVKPLSTDGLPAAMHAFDNSPILSDYGVLARWQQGRAATPGPVALYYNTISLHDGNQLPGKHTTSLDSYPPRVTQLMADIDRFTDLIAQSGRKAVIVFVPEHGAALRGDDSQIAGLREIPEPRVVHVPVGVKLVGLAQPVPQQVIEAPASYLALAQLLSNMVANSPFKTGAPAPATYAVNLPQTPMVGENEGTITLRTAQGFAVRSPDGVWVRAKP